MKRSRRRIGPSKSRILALAACFIAGADFSATARRLHDELFELNQSVFFDTNPIPIKYMMKRMGLLPNEEHRLPMMPATPELAERLDGVLRRAGLLPAGPPSGPRIP